MLKDIPAGEILGTTVQGLNVAASISESDFGQIPTALGRFGVLRLPDERLDECDIRRFRSCLRRVQVMGIRIFDPEFPDRHRRYDSEFWRSV